MLPRTRKLLLATLVAVSAGIASTQPLHPLVVETRVVAPLADPAVSPGVARCTSDGRCTVTDAEGTRPGSRLLLVP
jgi:hypothetical protein